MALTPFHLQVAGIVILVAIGLAAGWWLLGAAMGWHSGRVMYWVDDPRDDGDDDGDDQDDDGSVDGADAK